VGNGLWCDGDCTGGVYENNTIENNAKSGISHEVSHAWTIKHNVIMGNGFGTSWEWMGGTGVMINESDNVEVADNFVANNYRAIVMNMSNRPDYNNSYYDLANDYIHNNIIVTGGASGITGLYQNMNNNTYYTSKNNRFVSDTYCMPSNQKYFWWMDNSQTTSNWKGHVQDAGGTWACPAVFLSSPSNAATVSGTVSVNAAAADTVSIIKVLFYLDGTLVATDTSSPYSYSWNTTKSSNGGHILEAQAYNKAGQSSTSSVNVTVQNP
jgi:parallel beta-helix repeat protein